MYLRMLDDGLYDEYTQRLDKLLNDLRGTCLGYHLPFNDVLPTHFQDLSDKEKAQQLAQQLSFALAYVSNCTQQQINSAYHWFYEFFAFCLTTVPKAIMFFLLFSNFTNLIWRPDRQFSMNGWKKHCSYILTLLHLFRFQLCSRPCCI